MASSSSLVMKTAARVASKRSTIAATNAVKSRIITGTTTPATRIGNHRSFADVAAPTARKQVSKEERVALRAARRERAATVLQQQKGGGSGGAASEGGSAVAGASKQFMASKWVWYLGLGVPVGLLVWGFTDENSPPAKLANAIGLTSYLSSLNDEYAKPVHDKLLPDWSQVRYCIVIVYSSWFLKIGK